MIDVSREELIQLTDVPAFLPPKRTGKPISYPSVWRWAHVGIDGIKLEWLMLGGAKYTSKQALQRFAERQTAALSTNPATDAYKGKRDRTRAETRQLAAATA